MKDSKKNWFNAVVTAVILASLVVTAVFLLPYASAKGEYRERLESMPQDTYVDEIDMTAADMTDISLFEFAKIYAADSFGQSGAVGIVCVVMIVLLGVFSLGTLVFSALRKPVAILIFNSLGFIVFSLLSWDFKDRGVLPNSNYDIGAAHYIYYICAAIILAGAVFMLVMKIQQKKQKNISEVSDT